VVGVSYQSHCFKFLVTNYSLPDFHWKCIKDRSPVKNTGDGVKIMLLSCEGDWSNINLCVGRNLWTVIKAIVISATENTVEETVYGEQVNTLEYRLLESSVFHPALSYGTTVLVNQSENDRLLFQGIKEASPFKTIKFMLSHNLTQESANKLGKDIIDIGGYWERAFYHSCTSQLPCSSEQG
jgi:hypothetical protein